LSYHFKVSFDAQNITFIHLHTKGITVTVVIFQAWNLCSYLKAHRACSLNDEKAGFSKWLISWKIILEKMTGNVVTSKADALMYITPREKNTYFMGN
jgi:hypothetical protein